MREFPCGSDGKESACSAGDPGSIPGFWVGKIPWRRKWQPTSVFLPGESHGQRSLAGYSPWGHKELDTTDWLTHTHSFWSTWRVYIIDYHWTQLDDSTGRGRVFASSFCIELDTFGMCFQTRLMPFNTSTLIVDSFASGQPHFMYKSSSSLGNKERTFRMAHCLMNKASLKCSVVLKFEENV